MLIRILKGRHHETQTSGAEISHFYFLQYILQNCHFYTMKKKHFCINYVSVTEVWHRDMIKFLVFCNVKYTKIMPLSFDDT